VKQLEKNVKKLEKREKSVKTWKKYGNRNFNLFAFTSSGIYEICQLEREGISYLF
jgi:hypothetical protein